MILLFIAGSVAIYIWLLVALFHIFGWWGVSAAVAYTCLQAWNYIGAKVID